MAISKLFQRIIWHNNTTPAINEDNLNAMSKAIDDIDDRVISLAETIIEDVPVIIEGLADLDTAVTTATEAATTASNAATTATTKAGEASASATTASTKAGEASGSATTASNKADAASASATTAGNKALISEGFAVGEQDGTPVTSGSPYYQNNAEYYATEAGSSAQAAAASATEAESWSAHPPYIGSNGNWYVWDISDAQYEDSGIDASITVSVGTTSTLPAGSSAIVTNSGTSTDPVLNFGIPQGSAGTDGVSPEVTVTTITGGHTVTITDADHPSGQSFNVMDGAGNGDMVASTYDSDASVANAGGIAAYVNDSKIETIGNYQYVNGVCFYNGTPYSSTPAPAVGYRYYNFNKHILYRCTDITSSGSTKTYTWEEIQRGTQYDTMPSPASIYIGVIAQYVGTTTSSFVHGGFYECIQVEGTSTKTWVRVDTQKGIPTGRFNVLDYGLKGDNSTDNSAAFDAMLDDIAAKGRTAVIYFPCGRYRFSEPIVINKDGSGLLGVTLIGDTVVSKSYADGTSQGSPDSTLIYTGDANNTFISGGSNIYFFNVHGLHLTCSNGFNFDVNNTAFSSIPYNVFASAIPTGRGGINGIGAVEGMDISNCAFSGFTESGLETTNHTTVKECSFYRCNIGLNAQYDNLVNGCWFNFCGTAIKVNRAAVSKDWTTLIMNSTWIDQCTKGIHAEAAQATMWLNGIMMDEFDEAAILCSGSILDSLIIGHIQRAGMKYADISDSSRSSLLAPETDAIVATQILNTKIVNEAAKRNINKGSHSNGVCPSRFITATSGTMTGCGITMQAVAYADILDPAIVTTLTNTTITGKDKSDLLNAATYDSSGAVATAGGIPAYVSGQINSAVTSALTASY